MANTFNPYPSLGAEFTAGMAAISTTTIATVDDLVNAIYAYIQPIYYPASTPPRALVVEIKSVAYNIINAYNNKALGSTILYGPQQMNFVSMMLGLTTTNKTPIDALDLWFLDIEDNISKANLPIDPQTPLLLSIEFGKSIVPYWKTEVALGASSAWGPYFNGNVAIDWANIALWTEACLEGALIGSNASQKGLIAPTTDIVSVNIVSTMIGALAIAAGKVIFKWVPRIQPTEIIPRVTTSMQSFLGAGGIKGGSGNNSPQGYVVSWVGTKNGVAICDLKGPNGDEYCDVPDAGLVLGQFVN